MLPFVFPTRVTVEISMPTTSPTTSSRFPRRPAPSPPLLLSLRTFSGVVRGSFFRVVSRSLGWEKFSMVGHSMGGAVASLVAASFPEMVERCVFLDILGPFASRTGTSPKLLRASFASRSELQHSRVSDIRAEVPCKKGLR